MKPKYADGISLYKGDTFLQWWFRHFLLCIFKTTSTRVAFSPISLLLELLPCSTQTLGLKDVFHANKRVRAEKRMAGKFSGPSPHGQLGHYLPQWSFPTLPLGKIHSPWWLEDDFPTSLTTHTCHLPRTPAQNSPPPETLFLFNCSINSFDTWAFRY